MTDVRRITGLDRLLSGGDWITVLGQQRTPRYCLRIQSVDATLLKMARAIVCCIHGLKPKTKRANFASERSASAVQFRVIFWGRPYSRSRPPAVNGPLEGNPILDLTKYSRYSGLSAFLHHWVCSMPIVRLAAPQQDKYETGQ